MPLILPFESEVDYSLPREERAKALYPDFTFDQNFPPLWLELLKPYDPTRDVIWAYTPTTALGRPCPLTAEAALALAYLTINIAP